MSEILRRLQQALAGRYEVERQLGQGGMAIVYLASDLKHGRRVAIKVLKPELAYAIGPERFLREIAIAAQLTHPHILPLHDSGEADGLLYYVMPFVASESLRQRLEREIRIPRDEAVRITAEVADALSYAHGQGLIHRDIKPENILFQAGHALVSDFGIARAVSAAGSERLTETGLTLGTPAYMSPEQALGGELDARSDVYSLACVLFELLAGVPPFSGPTPQAIVAAHAMNPVPRLGPLGVSVPATIQPVLDTALAKAPEERFATAAAFADALAGGRFRPARVRRSRRRSVLALLLGALLLAGAGWIGRRVFGGSTSRISSLAVLPLENLSQDGAQEYLVAGIHEALIDELARISALRVISRTSTLAYRNSNKPVPQIARELAVDGVVEGSVLRAGDSVRIQVQLIRARPEERQLWAEGYQRDLGHVLGLYRDVAQAVAREIQVRVTPEERANLATARTVDPEAYEAYLQGKFHWQKLTPADIDAAQQYYEAALKKSPDYALAHAGIAEVWIARLQMGLSPPDQATPRASRAALRALALDSTLAEGHYDLAMTRTQTWDWDGSEAAYQRAFKLRPNFPAAQAFYSHLLNVRGRPEPARAQMDRAIAQDPLNPLFRALDGVNRLFERRWDDAVAQAGLALRTAPDNPVALNALWLARQQQGRFAEAAAAAAKYLASVAQPEAAAAVTKGFAGGDYRRAMRLGADALAAQARSGYVTLSDVATMYVAAGDNARALDWLERAYRMRDPNLPYLRLPCFDPLRGEARFEKLIGWMRLD
jgi:TolB-like protein/tRNA A-37 threonylcarbamoyl transferase component Bud32/Tfp pilus assembly protein PilF